MENESSQEQEETDQETPVKTVDSAKEPKKASTAIPLMITLIGIFCYLGVIIPSVFGSSNRLFDYSIFDILLMVGGAALVGLGAYFWFSVKAEMLEVMEEEDKKSLEAA
ncbi:MAG: hypothetical protein JSW00_08365 [Thermoplasmata archaeon]|nr:MAG: hypothetical protein JSW00_08365 [Thermoplasmata archaeon]